MEGEHLGLDRKTRLLVAEKLRNQRQVKPLASLRSAVGNLADELIAERPQIDADERLVRQPRKADTIGDLRRADAARM